MRFALNLRPEDRMPTMVGFMTLLGLMCAHAVMETARDTLFLNKLGASSLPWNYLAVAGLAIVATKLNQRMLERFDKRRVLSATSLVAGIMTLVFWFRLNWDGLFLYYALYVWVGLVATMVVVQFWLLMGDLFTVTQAKRTFGLVASGGLIGAALGSGIALQFQQYFDAHHLLLVAGSIFIATAFTPMCVPAQESTRPTSQADNIDRVRLLRSQPYLKRLLVIVLASTMVFTGVDFIFKYVVAERFAGEELGTFLARFYLVVNALSLVAQIVVTRFVMSRIGVSASVLVLPVLLLVGLAGVVLGPVVMAIPALASVLFLKGSDGALKHSIHRTATEILYFPLPGDVREKFKAFIDVVGQRGGQAVASLAILAVFNVFEPNIELLVIAVGVLVLIWIAVAIEMRRHYLELFRGNLRENQNLRDVKLIELDFDSLQTLVSTLNSQNDLEVLAALELFDRYNRIRLLPALILYHPSKEVVLRALELFAAEGREDYFAIAKRLLDHEDDDTRAAALRAMTTVGERKRGLEKVLDSRAILEQGLEDESNLVRATALVGMISSGFGDREELFADLTRFADVENPEQRLALVRAIELRRDPQFAETLMSMTDAPILEVRAGVAKAMGAIPHKKFIPDLVTMLEFGEVRNDARKSLVAIGRPALDYLDEQFKSGDLRRSVRRHIPRTISKFPAKTAVRVLLRHLDTESDDTMIYKILRGLGRLRADNPDLKIDSKLLRRVTQRVIEQTITRLDYVVQTEREHEKNDALKTRGGELLLGILREKERAATERIFRLLALINPDEDFELLFSSLSKGDQARAGSMEVLEYAIPSEFRGAILALIDETSDENRYAAASEAFGFSPKKLSYPELLTWLLEDESDAVRSIAAYHVAELHMVELEPQLKEAHRERGGFVSEVIDSALLTLRQAHA